MKGRCSLSTIYSGMWVFSVNSLSVHLSMYARILAALSVKFAAVSTT